MQNYNWKKGENREWAMIEGDNLSIMQGGETFTPVDEAYLYRDDNGNNLVLQTFSSDNDSHCIITWEYKLDDTENGRLLAQDGSNWADWNNPISVEIFR